MGDIFDLKTKITETESQEQRTQERGLFNAFFCVVNYVCIYVMRTIVKGGDANVFYPRKHNAR